MFQFRRKSAQFSREIYNKSVVKQEGKSHSTIQDVRYFLHWYSSKCHWNFGVFTLFVEESLIVFKYLQVIGHTLSIVILSVNYLNVKDLDLSTHVFISLVLTQKSPEATY